MRVLGIHNLKGGVGKTAAAVNLAYQAAASGRRTLIWDLDPQGATSFYFRVKPKVKGGGGKIVSGKSDLDDLIKATDFDRLDLLPADFSYRQFDLRFADSKRSRLRRLLRPLREEYDLVVFDCPPTLSELSEQVFRASNLLLVPLIPTTLSLRTFDQMQSFLARERLDDLPVRRFFSMVDQRKRLHREILEAHAGDDASSLPAWIPYSSLVERMGEERRPVTDFAPSSEPAEAFAALWRQVDALLD
jgi:cellulose biosynthesis protein BcsQ